MTDNFKSWAEIAADRPMADLITDLRHEWESLRDGEISIESSPIGLLAEAIEIKHNQQEATR